MKRTEPTPDKDGICKECREWTSVREACCGAPVLVDGFWYDPSDWEANTEEYETENGK